MTNPEHCMLMACTRHIDCHCACDDCAAAHASDLRAAEAAGAPNPLETSPWSATRTTVSGGVMALFEITATFPLRAGELEELEALGRRKMIRPECLVGWIVREYLSARRRGEDTT